LLPSFVRKLKSPIFPKLRLGKRNTFCKQLNAKSLRYQLTTYSSFCKLLVRFKKVRNESQLLQFLKVLH